MALSPDAAPDTPRTVGLAVAAGSNLAGVASIAFIWWLRERGLIAHTSFPLLILLVLLAVVGDLTTRAWVKRRPGSRLRVEGRVAVSVLATTAVIYAAGWGALLAIAYALCVVQMLAQLPGADWRTAYAWCIAFVVGAEIAVETGLAPSVLDPTLSHAVAIVGLAGLAPVLWVASGALATREIAEQQTRERERRLAAQVGIDALTQLPNRSALRSVLQDDRRGTRALIAFVDLDDFKDINDTFGHDIGDAVLVEVAARLQRTVRPQDVVARYGGDEFVVLVDDPAPDVDRTVLVDRIRVALDGAWDSIAPYALAASIGAVEDPTGDVPADELLRRADAAMYESKHGTSGHDPLRMMTSRALAHHRAAMDGISGTFSVLRAIRDDGGVVDWQVIEANAACRAHYEPVFGDPLGARCSQLPMFDKFDEFFAACGRANDTRRTTTIECDIALLTGASFWAYIVIVPVEDDTVAVMVTDITQQRRDRDALEAERARFAAVTETVSDIIAVVDPAGQITWVSASVELALGYAVPDVVGTSAWEIMHPDDRALAVNRLLEVVEEADGESQAIEMRLVDAHDNYRWFECSGTNKLDDPAVRGVVVTLHDITERREAAEALRVSELRSRAIVEAVAEAIITVDAGGDIREFNRAAELIFGIERHAAMGLPYTRMVPPENLVELRSLVNRGHTGQELAAVGVRANGEAFPARVSISQVEVDGEQMWTAVVRDVTEERATEDALRVAALRDELTGLPNRRTVLQRASEVIEHAAVAEGHVGLMFLDIDHFKLVNDALGHDIGDDVLKEVANRIAARIRGNDMIARIGGDDFVVLCEDVDSVQTMQRIGERIADGLREPIPVGDGEVFLTVSIGVAIWRATDTPIDLLRHAETAMYRAKSAGRSQMQLFDTNMQDEVTTRLEFESALRHAVSEDELEPYYQAIVDLDTHEVVAFEALARWNRPGVGVVMPNDFIPAAEQSGLIVELGTWMLERAASHCAAWQCAAPGVGVSVNVSVQQFNTGDFVTDVRRALDLSGLAPELLTLEITESVMFEHTDRNAAAIAALRSLGVHISLDDFGTGFSSLTYLRRLPIDSIKIDRSFLQALETDSRDVAMLRAIADLGATYNVAVVAEGIDTETKVATVRSVGCRLGQGFLFHRPAPLDEAIALLPREPLVT